MNSQRHFSQRRRVAFRPRLEQLETRDCPSCTVFQRAETLVILGDREANHIEIAEIREGGLGEEGGGISVVCDGSVIQTFTGVRQIDLRTLGGDDEVTFVCPSDPSTFLLRADLGAGNDRLNISGFDPQPEPPLRALSFDILAGAGDDEVRFDLGAAEINGRFMIFANGGAGNDRMEVAAGNPCVLPESEMQIGLLGGAGDDVIEASLTGLMNQGRFVLEANGGAGNDRMEVAAGNPCNFPESEMQIGLLGGAGDDVIGASLTDLVNYGRFVLEANGGTGNDRLEIVAIGKPCWLPESETQIKLNGDAGDDVIGASLTDLVNYGLFVLEASGGAGNDRMEVAVGDPCCFPESVTQIKLSGDAGDDVIEASLTGLMNEGRFLLEASGGAGNDQINGFFVPCILPGSETQIKLSGDAGDDVIDASLTELMNQGRSVLEADGGAGNDRIAARVELDEESRGGPHIRVLGGWGDDDLTLALYGVDVESLLTPLVDGGRGRDVAYVTRNVRVANCEEVFFLDDEGGLDG